MSDTARAQAIMEHAFIGCTHEDAMCSACATTAALSFSAEQTAALRAALALATENVEGPTPDDPARSLAKMLSKMDDEDKATFNWWHRQAKLHGAREAVEQTERAAAYRDALLAAPEGQPAAEPLATRESERQKIVDAVGECCGGGDPLCGAGCLVDKAWRSRTTAAPSAKPSAAYMRALEACADYVHALADGGDSQYEHELWAVVEAARR